MYIIYILTLIVIVVLAIIIGIKTVKGSGPGDEDICSFALNGEHEGLYINAFRVTTTNNSYNSNKAMAMAATIASIKIDGITNLDDYTNRYKEMGIAINSDLTKVSHCYIVFISTKRYTFDTVFDHSNNCPDIKIAVSVRHQQGECFFTPFGIGRNPITLHEKIYKNLPIALFKGCAMVVRTVTPNCMYLVTSPTGLLIAVVALPYFAMRPGLHLYTRNILDTITFLESNPTDKECLDYYRSKHYSSYNNKIEISKAIYKRKLKNYNNTIEEENQDNINEYIEDNKEYFKLINGEYVFIDLDEYINNIINSINVRKTLVHLSSISIFDAKTKTTIRPDKSFLAKYYSVLEEEPDGSVTIYDVNNNKIANYKNESHLKKLAINVGMGTPMQIEIDALLN
jgi:hypothetical protein